MSAAVIEAAEPEAEPRRGRRLLIIGVALLVVVGAAAGAWFLVFAPDADAAEEEVLDGEIVTIEPLTTTTGSSGLRHARVAMGVVLVEGVAPEEVTPKIALLQDALLQEVAEMDADQLRSPEGSDALRKQLSSDARGIWGDEVVKRVVLTELLVQ